MERQIIAERPDKTVFAQNGLCYKMFEPGYSKSTILSEALNQGLVEETGLNIPGLLEITKIDGCWTIVTEYIDGKTMEVLLEESPERENELLKQFVDIQAEMQTKRCPLLTKHRDKMNRKISETDLSATLRYDLHNRIEATPRHNFLCHGDFNPSNVIINSEGKAYIIDWTHATQGNREADAARTFLLFLLEGKRQRARKYLRMFCEATGCTRQSILEWLPILAASQSVKGIKDQTDFLYTLIFMDRSKLEALDE